MALQLSQQASLLARLRDEIRRIERRPGRREGFLATGLPAVDALLPEGGFPRGALSELRGGPASGKTGVALALVAALGREELVAWVDGAGELYPPAAAALGADLGRLLLVRPASPPRGAGGGRRTRQGAGGRDGGAPASLGALWAAEALLGSGAFALVVADAPIPAGLRGAEGHLRRLQAAAERGGAIGLWLAAPGAAGRVPAGVRLELALRKGELVVTRGGRGATAPSRRVGDAA